MDRVESPSVVAFSEGKEQEEADQRFGAQLHDSELVFTKRRIDVVRPLLKHVDELQRGRHICSEKLCEGIVVHTTSNKQQAGLSRRTVVAVVVLVGRPATHLVVRREPVKNMGE